MKPANHHRGGGAVERNVLDEHLHKVSQIANLLLDLRSQLVQQRVQPVIAAVPLDELRNLQRALRVILGSRVLLAQRVDGVRGGASADDEPDEVADLVRPEAQFSIIRVRGRPFCGVPSKMQQLTAYVPMKLNLMRNK